MSHPSVIAGQEYFALQLGGDRNWIWSNVSRIEAGRRSFQLPPYPFLPVHFTSEYLTIAGGFRRHGTHGISGKPRTKARETEERRKDTRGLEGSRSFLFDGRIRVPERNLRKWKRNAPWERMGIPRLAVSSFLTFPSVVRPSPSPLFFLPPWRWMVNRYSSTVTHTSTLGHEASKNCYNFVRKIRATG